MPAQNENPAQNPEIPEPILPIEYDHVLAIEWPGNDPNENMRNGRELSDYERNREQWWQNFERPIHRSTRRNYRQTAANTGEENLYQIM